MWYDCVMLIVAYFALSLFACVPAPCQQSCADFGAFVTACGDADGFLCNGSVTAQCVDDAPAYEECVESSFEPSECGYDSLVDAGVIHDCTSGTEARASCMRETRFHYSALETVAERTEYADGCAEESDFTNAIAAKDCETVCAMLE